MMIKINDFTLFLGFILALVGLGYGVAAPVSRAAVTTITVTDTGHEIFPFVVDGDCTLGEAITAANTDAAVDGCTAATIGTGGPFIIELANGAIYTLTAVDNVTDGENGLPSVTSDLTINGNGAIIVRDIPVPDFRLLHVAPGGGLTLNELTLANGRAIQGGNIYNRERVTILKSTITLGQAVDGGGIYNINGGTMEITNSTISGNSTTAGGGGGIFNASGNVKLDFSTVTNNRGTQGGGGILLGVGSVELISTIVADNPVGGDCNTTLTSGGHNLDSDNSCGLTLPTDLPAMPPGIGPLADNGGPTATHALVAGSPAIDAGSSTCPPTDQRNLPRPEDGDGDNVFICDIGAFELQVYRRFLPIVFK